MAKKTTTTKSAATRRAKTAKASANSKKVTTKAAKASKTSPKKASLLSPLNIHKFSAIASTLLAVVAGWLMSSASFPLTLGYLTKDALLSTSQTIFVPATRVQFEVELKWVMVALLAFSALYSLLLVTRWKSTYDKALKGRVFLWRWVYLAVSSAVLISVVAVISGVYDLLVIKLLAGATLVAYGLAWLSEWQNEKTTRRPSKAAYLAGLYAALLPWVVILGYALATSVYGMVRLPWFVYAAQAAALLATLAVFANLWMSFTRQGGWKQYANVERNYLVMVLLGQMAAAGILIVGLLK